MAVRTKSLAAAQATTTLTTIYTTPADETTIVKAITIGKFGAGAVVLTVTVLRGAVAYGVALQSLGVGAVVVDLARWLVLAPGDQLRVQTDTGTCTVLVSGTELEGVAD